MFIFILQQLAQPRQRLRCPPAHRRRGFLQNISGLAKAQPVQVMQHQHITQRRIQPIQRIVKLSRSLIDQHAIDRRPRLLLRRQRRMTAFSSSPRTRPVDESSIRDPVQPRCKIAVSRKGADLRPRRRECLLAQILGGMRVAHQPREQLIHAGVVVPDKLGTHLSFDFEEWKRRCRFPGLESPVLCLVGQ